MLLVRGVEWARQYWPPTTRLIARVLADNPASLAVCRQAGFVPVEYGVTNGRAYVRLERLGG